MTEYRHDTSAPIITIDGGAGTGKGTARRLAAEALGFHSLDSGALYRAIALEALRHKIDHDNEIELARIARSLDIRFEQESILLNGADETLRIRSDEAGKGASAVSRHQRVRDAVFEFHLTMRKLPGLVVDGRDGGFLFDTRYRYFLVTHPEEKARRRHNQFIELGIEADYDSILAEIIRRDEADTTRAVAPLRPHPEAIIIDTTDMTAAEVAARIIDHYRQNL